MFTEEEWHEYYQMLAEAEHEIEDEMYENIIESELGI